MNNIFALIIMFDEPVEFLERLFRSLENSGVNYIYVADGRFKEFEAENDSSNDNLIRFVLENSDMFIPCPDGGWQNQMSKRQTLLNQVPSGNWALIIDADEELIGNKINRDKLYYHAHSCRYFEPVNKIGTVSTRLWRKTDNLIYYGRHKYLYDKSKMHPNIDDALVMCMDCSSKIGNRMVKMCFDNKGGECEMYKIVSQGLLTRIDYTWNKYFYDIDGKIPLIKNYKRERTPERQIKKNEYYDRRHEVRFKLKPMEG